MYSPIGQVITGTGQYTITLPEFLANIDRGLNLYKLASSYLNDIPLLSGGNGDTGDMSSGNVVEDNFSFIWDPPILPSHFPTDKTAFLSIELVGQYNNVDTQAMGYAPIAPAFKPDIKVVFTSQRAEIMFGGFYNLAERQCFWCDNVGITPLISKTSPETVFH